MTFDTEVTTEVSDRIAEIGRRTLPVAKPAAYDSPEGVLFRKALALIADESRWVQGEFFTDDNRHCSIGALNRTDTRLDSPEREVVRKALGNTSGIGSIMVFNDISTHAEVMRVWREAGRANGWLL
jgi:hypothetical protein